MFTRKSLEKPVFLYLIIVLGACILSFGLYNIHERTGVTEGGVLGMTLLLRPDRRSGTCHLHFVLPA